MTVNPLLPGESPNRLLSASTLADLPCSPAATSSFNFSAFAPELKVLILERLDIKTINTLRLVSQSEQAACDSFLFSKIGLLKIAKEGILRNGLKLLEVTQESTQLDTQIRFLQSKAELETLFDLSTSWTTVNLLKTKLSEMDPCKEKDDYLGSMSTVEAFLSIEDAKMTVQGIVDQGKRARFLTRVAYIESLRNGLPEGEKTLKEAIKILTETNDERILLDSICDTLKVSGFFAKKIIYSLKSLPFEGMDCHCYGYLLDAAESEIKQKNPFEALSTIKPIREIFLEALYKADSESFDTAHHNLISVAAVEVLCDVSLAMKTIEICEAKMDGVNLGLPFEVRALIGMAKIEIHYDLNAALHKLEIAKAKIKKVTNDIVFTELVGTIYANKMNGDKFKRDAYLQIMEIEAKHNFPEIRKTLVLFIGVGVIDHWQSDYKLSKIALDVVENDIELAKQIKDLIEDLNDKFEVLLKIADTEIKKDLNTAQIALNEAEDLLGRKQCSNFIQMSIELASLEMQLSCDKATKRLDFVNCLISQINDFAEKKRMLSWFIPVKIKLEHRKIKNEPAGKFQFLRGFYLRV